MTELSARSRGTNNNFRLSRPRCDDRCRYETRIIISARRHVAIASGASCVSRAARGGRKVRFSSSSLILLFGEGSRLSILDTIDPMPLLVTFRDSLAG